MNWSFGSSAGASAPAPSSPLQGPTGGSVDPTIPSEDLSSVPLLPPVARPLRPSLMPMWGQDFRCQRGSATCSQKHRGSITGKKNGGNITEEIHHRNLLKNDIYISYSKPYWTGMLASYFRDKKGQFSWTPEFRIREFKTCCAEREWDFAGMLPSGKLT